MHPKFNKITGNGRGRNKKTYKKFYESKTCSGAQSHAKELRVGGTYNKYFMIYNISSYYF